MTISIYSIVCRTKLQKNARLIKSDGQIIIYSKLLDSNLINQGYFFKFNEGSILRADMKTQAECLAKYVNNGIYTPNEARY